MTHTDVRCSMNHSIGLTHPSHPVSKLRRTPKLRLHAGFLLLGLALSGLSCTAPPRAADEAVVLSRARVELGRGLRQVRVEAALLDTSRAPFRAQVDLSAVNVTSRKIRGYFQWKDEAGINLGGRAEQTKSIRYGTVVSFTSFAPSPEAYQYVFIAQNG